jgi:hypothetical protein
MQIRNFYCIFDKVLRSSKDSEELGRIIEPKCKRAKNVNFQEGFFVLFSAYLQNIGCSIKT